MRRRSWIILRVGIALCLVVAVSVPPHAAAGSAPLEFAQLDITGDEAVVVRNTDSQPAALDGFWLGYSSSDSATAVPVTQLPAITLQPLESVLLTNGMAATCGAVAVEDLGFSLSNSAGTLALWAFDNSDASFELLSAVSWGKGMSNPTYLHIADENNVKQYNSINPAPAWLHKTGSWQVGDVRGCVFTPVMAASDAAPPEFVDWQVDETAPPFTVLAPVVLSGDAKTVSIPAADKGLKAPTFSELFPDPAKPKTDAADEFIELYNPNTAAFDLSGFKLQIGSTTSSTLHSYTIPDETTIAGHGFIAFTSDATHLALNNTAGQAWLVDPLNHTASTSGPYSDVEAGMSWIRTGDTWQWTAQPTPGKANKLQTTITPAGTNKAATVNGRSVANVAGGSKAQVAGAQAASFDQAAQATPIHPATLAAVVAIALLYLAYEYRHDLANTVHQLRRHRANRS